MMRHGTSHDDTASTATLLVSLVSSPVSLCFSFVAGILDIALCLSGLVLGITLHVGKSISSLVICFVYIVV